MIRLTQITYTLLYLMLLSPLLSYISFGLLGLQSITHYFSIFTFFYGIAFIFLKDRKLKFPKVLYFLILYSLYLTIWSFWNGGLERRGFVYVLFNRDVTSIIFIIIIVYNTRFSHRFIKNSILIFKITVILAAIVSLIQVVDSSFMDANPLWRLSRGKSVATIATDLYTTRRASIFGYVNQNEIGLSYMPILSILIGIMLYRRKRFYFIFLILGGITSFLTNGRYIMIAFVLITFQILIVNKVKILGVLKYLFLILLSGFLLVKILSYLGYDFIEWANARLFAEGSVEENTRYKAIGTFSIFFFQSVFFGFGGVTEEMTEASYAVGSSQIHVGYLAHLAYYGIVGSFFLFGFWFLLAKKLYKTAKLTNYWGSFFAFLIFLWANATLVYFSIFFYGIIFAFVLDKYYLDNYHFNQLKKV